MATLTIRNLSDRVRDRLRLRAAKHGVSMEAEARSILAQAVDARSERKQSQTVAELQDWIASNRKRPQSDKNDSAALIRDRRRETILEVIRAGDEPAKVFGNNYRRVLAEADWTLNRVKSLMRTSR
jgi:plasmid stability protein